MPDHYLQGPGISQGARELARTSDLPKKYIYGKEQGCLIHECLILDKKKLIEHQITFKF